MSGIFVPYHQRQNKAVDRHLFIELLGRLNRRVPIPNYTYVGFGGPFLEDFKLLHAAFGNRKLFSLESNEIAWRRQKFNLPLNCITPLQQASGDFINSYSIEKNAIIWLDYTSPGERREQINEIQSLLPKLQPYDVLKVTLNANPETLSPSVDYDGNRRRLNVEEVNEKRFRKLTDKIGDFIPHDVSADWMTRERLPRALVGAFEVAANDALKGQPSMIFQPLMIFSYEDSIHQMLTITGILLPKKDKTAFIRDCGLRQHKLTSLSWGDYKKIMLPALTAKERLFIDQHLPKWGGRRIQRRLKFWFDSDEEKSLEILHSYIQFYRQYPNFHRVLF